VSLNIFVLSPDRWSEAIPINCGGRLCRVSLRFTDRDRLRNSASNAEPCQPAGEIAGREIDVQNSSVRRIARGLGAVKDRR
jgi:hypothetical protein